MQNITLEQQLKTGLYAWYPFEKDSKIFYALDEKSMDISMEETASYDYVVVAGVLESCKNPQAFLRECKRILKEKGHFLLGVENRYGLRYFCGDREPFTDKNYDGIENYRNYMEQDREIITGRLYADYEIRGFLDEVGFMKGQRFSVLPGLEMPQQFYCEDYLPEEEVDIRFTGIYHHPNTVFLHEEKLYDGIIKNGMFHQMANAYLYDYTVSGELYGVNHVTTSMDRGMQKATATIIQKDGLVVKKAIFEEGNSAIQTLIDNTDQLKEKGINIVPLTQSQNTLTDEVKMPYIKAQTALAYLRELLVKDKDAFLQELDRYVEMIRKSSELSEAQPEHSELGEYYKRVYVDMVPLNCFYQNGEFVFYDQEYVEENYPINVLIVRSLDMIYRANRRMMDFVSEKELYGRYGVYDKLGILRDMGSKYIQNLRSKGALEDFSQKHKVDPLNINLNREKINYSLHEYVDIFVNFMDDLEDKKLYIFGSGQWARKFVAEYGDSCAIEAMIDNNTQKHGTYVDGVRVTGLKELETAEKEKIKVIICVKYYAGVLQNLKASGIKNYGIYDPYADYSMLKIASGQLAEQRMNNGLEDQKVESTETGEGSNTSVSKAQKKYKKGYIAGVFDLFHVGHLNMFKRAKEQCEYLLVGVVSDEQASAGKNRSPFIGEQERLEIVKACRYVDEAYILPVVAAGTRDVYKKHHFDVQFSGSDYEKDAQWLREQKWLRERGADLVFFPYTQSTSSTKIKKDIESMQ